MVHVYQSCVQSASCTVVHVYQSFFHCRCSLQTQVLTFSRARALAIFLSLFLPFFVCFDMIIVLTALISVLHVCKCMCVHMCACREISAVKLYSRKIFSYVFCVWKYFTTEKANYGIYLAHTFIRMTVSHSPHCHCWTHLHCPPSHLLLERTSRLPLQSVNMWKCVGNVIRWDSLPWFLPSMMKISLLSLDLMI